MWNSKTDENMYWCPEYGDIEIPPDWGFVPTGDAFLTRTLKRLGKYWVLLRRKDKYTITLGLLCATGNIDTAKRMEHSTQSEREERRSKNRKYRDRAEAKYRKEMERAMFSYLNFSKKYHKMATGICSRAAERATEVGVGRTRLMPIEERAILAVRAYIRHEFTSYEGKISRYGEPDNLDREIHRMIKGEAMEEVDEFIWNHQDNNVED